jgi:hypothetical protein
MHCLYGNATGYEVSGGSKKTANVIHIIEY